MAISEAEFVDAFRGESALLEYAINCPIRFDVWRSFALNGRDQDREDLILTARPQVDPRTIASDLVSEVDISLARLVVSGEYIVVSLDLRELLCHVVPRTSLDLLGRCLSVAIRNPELFSLVLRRQSLSLVFGDKIDPSIYEAWHHFTWFAGLLASVIKREPWTTGSVREPLPEGSVDIEGSRQILRELLSVKRNQGLQAATNELARLLASDQIDSVLVDASLNRPSQAAVLSSRKTVKADAARQLFDVDCSRVLWAVLDSGIDATHDALVDRRPEELLDRGDADFLGPDSRRSRVRRTYDFRQIRDLVTPKADGSPPIVDWASLEPLLRVPHDWDNLGKPVANGSYRRPVDGHGTHVAGIIGGFWPDRDGGPFVGICPDIAFWDLRVLGDDRSGDEFSTLTALQFIRWANERPEFGFVAGANLSLEIPHRVESFACGWTPVCVECDRVVRAGVVVVTVAGNQAFSDPHQEKLGRGMEYRTVSVTDPGNADRVITVGSTHKDDPHRHGVSYFSGRGPTADGRQKPDLLAPGEQILSLAPSNGSASMTGTSQAAPHVSGAAALLLARYQELLGRPEVVKQVLCDSATDLGRTATFQGRGLVDALRALQSI